MIRAEDERERQFVRSLRYGLTVVRSLREHAFEWRGGGGMESDTTWKDERVRFDRADRMGTENMFTSRVYIYKNTRATLYISALSSSSSSSVRKGGGEGRVIRQRF